MANWLDKYENGGEYLGTTNKGFNYNGAWNGPSMQMGGNLQPPMAGAVQTVPMAQDGYWSKNKKAYVDSVLTANKNLDWVKRLYEKSPKAVMVPGESHPSTHLISDNDQGYVFPQIANINGQLVDLGNRAEDYARETNTGIQLPREQGTWFARTTSDKSGYKMGTGVLKGKPVMQKYKKQEMGGSLPGSLGFTYARTQGIPSEGPYAKKTLPSAQNGQEMQFYQNALDWTPRNISEYGSEIPKAQPGITQPLRGDIQTRGNQNLLTEIAAQRTKDKKAQESRTRTTIGADTRTAKQKEKDREYAEQINKRRKDLGFIEGTGHTQQAIERDRAKAERIIHNLVDVPATVMGAGELAYLGGKGVAKAASKAGEYLTTQTPLKNTYNLIPEGTFSGYSKLRNANKSYRVAGMDAYDDFVESGVLRSKTPTMSSSATLEERMIGARPTGFPSFQKGYADLSYLPDEGGVIFETGLPTFKRGQINPVTGNPIKGRHYAHRVIDPQTGATMSSIPGENITVYGSQPHWLKGYPQINTPKQLPGSGNVAPVVNTAPVPTAWTMQEMPGLHLKSTMTDGAISKIVEPKTGLVNVEQALGIIGKESGGADKVALIKKGLGETLPKKMDYNDFRKVVQDQLIPLERQFRFGKSDYGIDRIGYKSFNAPDQILENGKWVDNPLNKNIPIENQTLILGNKGKFGRGSSAHGNPEETLGHIHFLRDAETPDILTVTQIQSDAFQGTHRIMPKTQQEALEKVNKLKEEGIEIKSMFGDGKESSNSVLANYEKHLQLDEASAKNFTQKQLLDKNHQERYLQELVDYAGKRGDVNKVRVPTSETAAKVQGYSRINNRELLDEVNTLKMNLDYEKEVLKTNLPSEQYKNNVKLKITELEIKLAEAEQKLKNAPIQYSSEQQTILKKYSEQPKTIKKLFGEEPKIVTDGKGNTWYEFDIPEKFKKGKGEIKAFGLVPPAAIIGAGAIEQKKKGGVVKDNMGYWNPDNHGKIVEIDSPNITMQGVDQPLLGISDTGDVQYMEPGNDYTFEGNRVTEYPIAKYGVNQQDEKTVQHLDQLLNFTNKPKAKNGGWLDKYN